MSIVNQYTFQVQSGAARMTMTFTRNGQLVTTHEYGGTLVKRVGVTASRDEVEDMSAWLLDNMKVPPLDQTLVPHEPTSRQRLLAWAKAAKSGSMVAPTVDEIIAALEPRKRSL